MIDVSVSWMVITLDNSFNNAVATTENVADHDRVLQTEHKCNFKLNSKLKLVFYYYEWMCLITW